MVPSTVVGLDSSLANSSTSAAALVIAVSQLKYLFGLELETVGTLETFIGIVQGIGQTNYYDLAIGAGAILVILGLKKMNRKLPAAMVVVILSIIGIYLFMVNETGEPCRIHP